MKTVYLMIKKSNLANQYKSIDSEFKAISGAGKGFDIVAPYVNSSVKAMVLNNVGINNSLEVNKLDNDLSAIKGRVGQWSNSLKEKFKQQKPEVIKPIESVKPTVVKKPEMVRAIPTQNIFSKSNPLNSKGISAMPSLSSKASSEAERIRSIFNPKPAQAFSV